MDGEHLFWKTEIRVKTVTCSIIYSKYATHIIGVEMARTLDEKDIALLKKLAPELEEFICEHVQMPFKSILPPLANHFAPDMQDFERRIKTLTDDELKYLVDRILNGAESISCVPPEHIEAFISLVANRISHEAAKALVTVYLEWGCNE